MTFPYGARKSLRFWYDLPVPVVEWVGPVNTNGFGHAIFAGWKSHNPSMNASLHCLPVQRGNVSMPNLQVLNAILYAAGNG